MAISGAVMKMSGLTQAANKVQKLFSSRYLLLTNTAITVCLSCSGDALQQHYQKIKKQRIRLDKRRSGNVALTGLLLGPFCHYWYLYLDRWFPGRTFRIIVKKLIVDQIICSPVVIGSYLAITSWFEGRRGEALKRELIEKGKTLYKADWAVWPAAQAFNFYFLPTRFRVLYDNAISFGFDCYFAHIKYGTEHQTDLANESDDSDIFNVEEIDEIFRNRTPEMEKVTHQLMQRTCCGMPYIHLIRTTVCNHTSKKGVIHMSEVSSENLKDSEGGTRLELHLICEECDQHKDTVTLNS